MHFCSIAPIPHLEELAKGEYHLLLAHLSTPTYNNYYRRLREKGAYLIVDNSAYEFDRAIPWRQVTHMAMNLKAQEVVLPDALRDSVQTYEMSREALRQTPTVFRVMMVPQGGDRREWEWCLTRLLDAYDSSAHTKAPVIGLSKVYEKWREGRYGLLEYLTGMREKFHFDVHMLGMTTPVSLEAICRAFPWVRSIDSAKPITAAKNGIQYVDKRDYQYYENMIPKRSDQYFLEPMNDYEIDCAVENITFVSRIADGTLTLF